MTDPYKYYTKPTVQKEISAFLKDRWVAVHCQKRLKDGRYMLIRYAGDKPLKIDTPQQVLATLHRLSFCKPRTFYGTAALYHRLETKQDLTPSNMYAYTPSWDIDSRPEWWKHTITVAKILVEQIQKEGVQESVWIKWSGRGIHVHIHEKAISQSLYQKYRPLDIAYSIVQYILEKTRKQLEKTQLPRNINIKIENLIDPQRVFTAPLSLHRQLDVSCIAMKPHQLSQFTPGWLNPEKPQHNPEWKTHKPGEADKLALKAIRTIGGYPGGPTTPPGRKRTRITIAKPTPPTPPPPPPPPQQIPPKIYLVTNPPKPLQKPPKNEDDIYRELSTILSRYALALDPKPKTLTLLKALQETTKINPNTKHLQPIIQQATTLVQQLEPTQLRTLLKPAPITKHKRLLDFI